VPASGATSPKTKKKSVTKRSTAASKATQRKRVLTAAEAARARRMKKAFVASSELKPMAQQLLDTRSAAAYKGVEKFAKAHANTDEGSLAWLLLGYARMTDKDPDHDRAIDALKTGKPHASDLSDYVDFLLATA
jgi:soluble lytic murein transglycosylase